METKAPTTPEDNRFTAAVFSRTFRRTAGVFLALGLLLAACGGSDSVDTSTASGDTTEAVASSEAVPADDVVEVEEAQADEPATSAEVEEAQADEPAPPAGDEAPPADGQGPPQDGQGPPQDGQGPPQDGQGPPQGDAADDAADNSLSAGPQNVGEHGPFSNADLNRDDTVTRAELDEFMDGALEREIGLVAFFDIYDSDADDVLNADELATVDPAFAFDGTDANGDGLVSLDEVTVYANEEGRSYRAIGLGNFFDAVDTNDDNEVSPEEIEVAHESGLLARF